MGRPTRVNARAMVAVATFAGGVAACNLLAGLTEDYAYEGDASSTDGAAVDERMGALEAAGGETSADAIADVSDAGTDTNTPGDASADANPLNMVTNGDFEQGCGFPWTYNTATGTADSTARAGSKSCRVCPMGNVQGWSIRQSVMAHGDAGRKFTAEAWIHAPVDGGAAISISCKVSVKDKNDTDLQPLEGAGSPIAATGTWTLCQSDTLIVSAASADAGTAIEIAIIGNLAGGCFLVDDAVLVPVP